MEATLEKIRDQQKQTWNTFAPGWKKWDDFTMEFLKPMGDAIIRDLHLHEDNTVLDVATGTGEPGLTIASIVKKGSVIGTDISENMLKIADENAKMKGLQNFKTRMCDITELPFEDNSFDAVSCRMGFMFFPDTDLAVKEMKRVMRKGGRIATSVWGPPEKNPWVTVTMKPIFEIMELPHPPSDAPGIFRCASKNYISDLLSINGFSDVNVTDLDSHVEYESKEHYWQLMNELAAPVVSAMSAADDATRSKIKKAVFEGLDKLCPDGKMKIECNALIISAQK
ncbi:MAG: methyltransferase domain-containing protein [Bacteroidetes bacterium]|nr:MAG: methyltransferase domain-containing protein [Bacteroidota bacterium]REK05027.1 MAG: methyltransferase domain-containing protein [Bacteroidota bacterium]REK36470.1 MAG: methyltransferase domain-containing protein [Bacteroidota bacterium]REK51684.1 MAG: methyltransferase domain-containing protein [Bacteroidota bacterium]